MKTKTKIYILLVAVFGIWLYVLHLWTGDSIFDVAVLALIFEVATFLMYAAIKAIIWRVQNGVDVFASLETDPETLKLKILLKMHRCTPYNFIEVANEIVEESHNYPLWEIVGSRMFQSWYKYNIDYMLERPSLFDLSTFDDGKPYIKEDDPYYNINADSWEGTDWINIKLDEIELVN